MRNILLFMFCTMSAALWADDFALGADISWCTEMEAKGLRLQNYNGEERECTALMKEMGMNAIRLRVWVDPSKHDNWCDKNDVLVKALRAKRLGMDIMIDFHYSDWWADPAKQNIPKSWEKMSFKKMCKALAAHTEDVLTFLRDNGITPRWVQVGNETSNGMLWSVKCDPVTGWEIKDAQGNTTITKSMGHVERNPEQYAGFIRAGYDAVKKVCPDAIVIVHLDNGFDASLYNHNLDIVKRYGGKWDMIGMSLYPYWAMDSKKEPNAWVTISDCMKNIRQVSKKYDCDVMIVETGFEVDESRPWVMAMGREQYADIIRRARSETGGRCKGVFYWEPECLPSQYKLGAFGSDGRPTDIMRALADVNVRNGLSHYDRPVVEIKTTEGDIYVELMNETPIHRDAFLRITELCAFDSVLFHRVIKDFMIQFGDPTTKDAPPTSVEHPSALLGEGDFLTADGQTSMPAEILFPRLFHKRGALAAAREPDDLNPEKRSSSSQFYIVWGKWPAVSGRAPYAEQLGYYKEYQQPGTPWLDAGYTVFGQVMDGLDTIDRIQRSQTDSNDRPVKDVRILSMRRLPIPAIPAK